MFNYIYTCVCDHTYLIYKTIKESQESIATHFQKRLNSWKTGGNTSSLSYPGSTFRHLFWWNNCGC